MYYWMLSVYVALYLYWFVFVGVVCCVVRDVCCVLSVCVVCGCGCVGVYAFAVCGLCLCLRL